MCGDNGNFQRDNPVQKWTNELKTRSVNQLLQIDVGVPWNQKKWLMVALAKSQYESIDYRYVPPWMLAFTGLRVKAWRIKSSTGHDEKEDSLKANN